MTMQIDLSNFLDEIRKIIKEELTNFSTNDDASLKDEKPVTQAELCEFLGVTEPTILRMRKRGEIPFFLVGSAVRFNLKDVTDALDRKAEKKSKVNYRKIYTEDLSDYYVKARLRRKGFTDEQILKDEKILELQRNAIKIKREIKNVKK